MSGKREAIDVIEVSLTFPSISLKKARETILDRISFQVGAGRIMAIMGPTGCGKSSLLAMLCGVLAADSGVISLNRKPPQVAQHDHEIGVIFQKPLFFDWRTAIGNVEMPLLIAGCPAARSKAMEALQLFGMEQFADHLPQQLSGGMLARVALSRAFAASPPVLLFDEAFNGLDAMLREEIRSRIETAWMRYLPTLLFVTHSVEDAIFLADDVLVLSHRPAREAARFPVELDRPRVDSIRHNRESFVDHTNRLSNLLRSCWSASHAEVNS